MAQLQAGAARTFGSLYLVFFQDAVLDPSPVQGIPQIIRTLADLQLPLYFSTERENRHIRQFFICISLCLQVCVPLADQVLRGRQKRTGVIMQSTDALALKTSYEDAHACE